ncbi:MAG: 16S rRNA (adenine(1518)-N(6)/adenine(1519)-N(6))-dimethyltransferase RsmA [Candidatus Izemoplasmatales bacterium]
MKKIGTINEIKSAMKKNDLHVKKHFGQNFLVDQNILNQIVASSGISKATSVIEIGPGLGSLTQKLLENAKEVLAYEIDKDLIPILESEFKDESHFYLLHQDILEAHIDDDIDKFFKDETEVVVVANLPYYITTPILMKFLETSKRVSKLILMVQLEVASRMASKPNSKDYNSLSIAIQYRAETKILFKVPRTVFIPEPNVDSAIIEIQLRDKPLFKVENEEFFFGLVRQTFAQRRKTLYNNLRNAYPNVDKEMIETAIKDAGIEPSVRAEALPIESFVRLSNEINKIL